MDPPAFAMQFLICCSVSKEFCLHCKAFDLLYTMRYILWGVALLDFCDISKQGCHLGHQIGFYQELEIRLKKRENNIFQRLTCKITHKYLLCIILSTNSTFSVEKKFENMHFTQKWLDHLLHMTSYLITIVTDHH